MLKLFFVLIAVVALAVFPVMYTARALNAQRTSLGWVIAALVIGGALSKGVDSIVSSGLLLFLISLIGGAVVYQFVLETTFKKGLVISLVSSVVFVVGILLVIAMLGGTVHTSA